MASWILVPSLVSLRNEFNELAPNRDKASDGSIGDQAHSQSSSDHNPDETGATPFEDADSTNEVHAIDVDKDLRRSGWTMEKAVEIIVLRHRRGDDDRLQNVIYNERIWSRQWGWTARVYTGANPHNQHAHFSARYTTTQERDTSPWGLLPAKEWDELATEDQIEAAAKRGAEAALNEAHRIQPNTVAVRLQDGDGWANMSDRAMLGRLFEGLLGVGEALTAFITYEKAEDTGERSADDVRSQALARLESATARIESAVTVTG